MRCARICRRFCVENCIPKCHVGGRQMERIVRVVGFARVDEAMRLAVPKLGWVLTQMWYYHQQLSVQ